MPNDHSPVIKKRVMLVFLVLLLMSVSAGGAWFLARKSSKATPSTPHTITRVETVSKGTITQLVSASGTIEPANQDNVNFAVSGSITTVSVSLGTVVNEGQTLATLASAPLAANLAQAQATLAVDQSTLSADQASSASQAQITSDSAAVAAAQNQVSTAQSALNDATLVSPISGTVEAVNLSVGQDVSGVTDGTGAASSSSKSSSAPQFLIISTKSFIVNASVNSNEVSRLAQGDAVTLTQVGSIKPFHGTVASISLLASNSGGVGVPTFPVVVDVSGDPNGLYGGSNANLLVVAKPIQDVTVVPTTALTNSGTSTAVILDQGGSKILHKVITGAASGLDTEITSGLTVGQKIYVIVSAPNRTITKHTGHRVSRDLGQGSIRGAR